MYSVKSEILEKRGYQREAISCPVYLGVTEHQFTEDLIFSQEHTGKIVWQE